MRMWVFPAFFSVAGVTGRGEAARSRLVDARREAVGGEERPFSRDFSKSLEERWSQKRGGAKGGAPSYTRRTATSLALLLSFALLSRWFMRSLPVVWLVVLWSALFSGGAGRWRVRATQTGGAALPDV